MSWPSDDEGSAVLADDRPRTGLSGYGASPPGIGANGGARAVTGRVFSSSLPASQRVLMVDYGAPVEGNLQVVPVRVCSVAHRGH